MPAASQLARYKIPSQHKISEAFIITIDYKPESSLILLGNPSPITNCLSSLKTSFYLFSLSYKYFLESPKLTPSLLSLLLDIVFLVCKQYHLFLR